MLKNKQIISGPFGDFLMPPTFPDHFYHVVLGNGKLMSLSKVIETKIKVDIKTYKAVKRLHWKWYRKPPLRYDLEIITWQIDVMKFYKDCYKGYRKIKGDIPEKRNSWKNHIRIPDLDIMENQGIHVGIYWIRKYFPYFKLSKRTQKNLYWKLLEQNIIKEVKKPIIKVRKPRFMEQFL